MDVEFRSTAEVTFYKEENDMWTFIADKWRETINHWRDYPLRTGTVWMVRYRIERFLGMGSYGQAYACTDMENGSAVLLKRNMPSKRELGRLLLERESRILQSLNHPQIPKWIHYAKRGRDEALIMELIEGDNLEHKMMVQGRTFTLQEALGTVKELIQPLKHLHQAGFVHRDVRIPNVLERSGSIYLIDYGLACRIGEQLPVELRTLLKETDSADGNASSPQGGSWAAVKRRMRKPYPSSDLYGLGHLFLFMMYAGYQHDEGQAERSWEEELELPPAVNDFVRRLLQQNEPGWLSAEQCEQELEKLMAAFS